MFRKILLVLSWVLTGFTVANAAVTYVNPTPDITYNTDGMQNPGIDLDNNGVVDIKFRLDYAAANFYFYHLGGLNGGQGVMDAALGLNPGGGAPYWKIITAGTSIGAASNFQANTNFPEPVLGDIDNNNIINAGDCFLGIKFKIGTNTHYGWLRVNLTGSTANLVPNVIKDWAYESTPNTAINAGAMGTGSVLVTGITVTGQGNATTITTNGGTLQMNAAILPANATNQNITWSVQNGTGTANISATGLLTAQTNGTVTVKATAQDGSNISGTKVITITNQNTATVPVTSIAVSGQGGSDVITTSAGTLQMNATVLPANASNQNVTWSVLLGTGSATINATGILTAQTDGTVTVKATAQDGSNISGTKIITISNQSSATVLVTSIVVNGQAGIDVINVNDGSLQMVASILPTNATNQNVTWALQNGTGTATIGATGLLTAQSNGTVTVKAIAKDGSGVSGTKVITISNQSTTGITEAHKSGIKIYPNPASDFLNITLEKVTGIIRVEIFNIGGQKVLADNSASRLDSRQINISGLQAGIYFLQYITTEGKMYQMKFQKIN